MTFRSIPVRWTSELKSVARIIFGFLLFRHGMEQVLGYPDAFTDAAGTSLLGVLKLLAFPGGLLMMLGLLTRPVALVFSVGYPVYWLVGPFVEFLQGEIALFGRPSLFGAGGAPSDPLLLTAFFFLYLFTAGPGVWSLDRLWNRDADAASDSRWAARSLAALRFVAGFLYNLSRSGKGLRTVPARSDVDARIGGVNRMRGRSDAHAGPLLAPGRLPPVR